MTMAGLAKGSESVGKSMRCSSLVQFSLLSTTGNDVVWIPEDPRFVLSAAFSLTARLIRLVQSRVTRLANKSGNYGRKNIRFRIAVLEVA